MQRYVYIVFSATPYKIGKLIRTITKERYNHVSLALDRELENMYSFARRYYHTPFYGGFVRESRARYHLNGVPAQVKICRLAVSEKDFEDLAQRLRKMYERREDFLYNHISVLTVPFRRLVHLKDAAICTEFVAGQLQELGMAVDSRRYYSVGALEQLLADQTVYEGDAPKALQEDPAFFAHHPVPYFTTARTFGRLLQRLVK